MGEAMGSLGLIADLLEELHRSNISYCHWKGNKNQERSLMGESDLDLLIASSQRMEFERSALRLSFVPVRSPKIKHFDGLEDMLGYDEDSGKVVHLHVHYALVLGEARVLNHRIPIEDWLLSRCRTVSGVRVPRAEDELMLFCIRALLKASIRSCLRALLGRVDSPFPHGVEDELHWLCERAADREVSDACHAAGLDRLTEAITGFLARARDNELHPVYVFMAKRRMLRKLRPFERYSSLICWVRKLHRRVRYTKIVRRMRPLKRKTLVGDGIYLAVVGADGSGKSTLTDDLVCWLDWKLECRKLYFGQPKSSVVVKGLRRAKKIPAYLAARLLRSVDGSRTAPELGRSIRVIDGLVWGYIARRRRRLDDEARRRARAGEIVIAERFPLQEFWEMDIPMDGPRLDGKTSEDGMLRLLSRYERGQYDRIGAPDRTFVLRAGLETLRARKPDTPELEHAAKARAVLRLPATATRDVLDAEKSYDDVLAEARFRLWSLIEERSKDLGSVFEVGH